MVIFNLFRVYVIGASELVRVADQYGQITARLQLATRATGDFADVQ